MTRRTQQFLASFAITLMLIGALCLFQLVDLSTDRYIPSQTGPILQIHSVDGSGIRFWALGKRYRLDSSQFDRLREVIWQYRCFLPGGNELAGAATTRVCQSAREWWASIQQPEEPW